MHQIATLHEPTEKDWRQLILALWPEGKIDYKKILSDEVTSKVLTSDEQKEVVEKFQNELKLTFPQNVDWSNLTATQQELTETVSKYRKRLMDNIKEYGFVDPDSDQIKPMIVSLFITSPFNTLNGGLWT